MNNSGRFFLGPRFFSGVLFLLPALVLTVHIGVGVIEAAILLATLAYARPLWLRRGELFCSGKAIVAAFSLNFMVALISSLWTNFHLHYLDNPFRQLLATAAIGLIMLIRPRSELFWYGLFTGTLGAAAIAFYQRFELDLSRAEGFHMAIMFGDIALAMGLMSLASIQRFMHTRLAWLPYLAFFAGLSASILSESRGGWLALAFSFIPLYVYGQHTIRRGMALIILTSIMLFTAACFVPNLNVRERVADVSMEIQQYQLGNAGTSVGARLEMWKGAWKLFVEHPVAGVGRANFNSGLNDLIARGEIDPAIRGFYHAHNEMLHALATQGVIGGAALFFIYAAPLAFFVRTIRRNEASQSYALAGLLLVLSFVDFGLTQVLFAHHVGAAFYALTISVLTGICLAVARND